MSHEQLIAEIDEYLPLIDCDLYGQPFRSDGLLIRCRAALADQHADALPREPTKEMLEAGFGPFLGAHDPMFSMNEPCGPIWKAMYDVAPISKHPRALDANWLGRAVGILREVDRWGVLHTATQREAGAFVREYEAALASQGESP